MGSSAGIGRNRTEARASLQAVIPVRQTSRHSRSKLTMHPGEIVVIFGITSSGPYLEGRAAIESACLQPHHYRVLFAGEKTSRVRFVHPDWQTDPERCLRLLRVFWQASTAPSVIEEFFPADLNQTGGIAWRS